MNFEISYKKNSKGFTIIEVLASVMVLSVGLVGSLTLINYNLRNISNIEKKIIASGLMEDGLERARNVRDTNWMKEVGWDTGFDIPNNGDKKRIAFFCDSSLPGSVNTEGQGGSNWTRTIEECNGNTCRVFEYDLTSQFACYSDNFGNSFGSYVRVNPRTEFRRLVTAERISNTKIKIRADIMWPEGSENKKISAEEILYKWQ